MTTLLHERAEEYLRLRRALGFRLEHDGHRLSQFADYLRAARRLRHHRGARDRVGAAAAGSHPVDMDPAAHRRPRVRGLAAHHRSRHGDPAQGRVPRVWQTARPVHLHRRRHRPGARRLRQPPPVVPVRDLYRPFRPYRGHRRPCRGGPRHSRPAASTWTPGCCRSAPPSPAASGSSPCTPPPSRRSPNTRSSAPASTRRRRRSSRPSGEPCSATALSLRAFREACAIAGIPGRPRIHDVRHSLAVNTLLEWYRSGEDVAAQMPALSGYLGHTNPEGTYWYISAVPELMQLAAARAAAKEGGDE